MDPRIQHILKWVLSVGDSVAVGDFDGDGKPDLFFNQPLKRPEDRSLALYRNLGNYKFERVRIPALEERAKDVSRKYGLPTNAMFVDYNNDGSFGSLHYVCFRQPLSFSKNTLKETGKAGFVDVTHEVGLDHYTNSVAANVSRFQSRRQTRFVYRKRFRLVMNYLTMPIHRNG